MVLVLACHMQPPKPPFSKRVSRLRRSIESKRIDTLKKIHESLKQAAKEETEVLREFWRGLSSPEEEGEKTEPSKDVEDLDE